MKVSRTSDSGTKMMVGWQRIIDALIKSGEIKLYPEEIVQRIEVPDNMIEHGIYLVLDNKHDK